MQKDNDIHDESSDKSAHSTVCYHIFEESFLYLAANFQLSPSCAFLNETQMKIWHFIERL